MKLKGLIFLAIFAVLAALSLSQSKEVSAEVRGPASPITKPITYFTYYLRGKISYRLFKYPIPAIGINVTAQNLSSGGTFSAKTDIKGAYTLEVKQASSSALYVIKPASVGAEGIRWIPDQYKQVISRDINNLDFVGTK